MNDGMEILEALHPIAKRPFAEFYEAVKKDPLLDYVRPFEGWRSPEAQRKALSTGHSKVGPWRSVHQYGCACDFVPCPAGKWSWDFAHWDALHRLAERFGLHAPIEWDKAHIVLVGWRQDLRTWLHLNNFT